MRRSEFAVYAAAGVIFALLSAGCAEINPFEAPGEVMRHPLGTEVVRIGMTKDEVVSEWGKPDIVNRLDITDATGMVRAEWIYKARGYSPVPVNASYLSKSRYLYFDGKNLVRMSDRAVETEE